MKEYSVRKSKKILVHLYRGFLKKKSVNSDQRSSFLALLKGLQDAILNNNPQEASDHAKKAESFYAKLPQRRPSKRVLSFIIGLSLALLAAVLIRQMWFELYEIPTGSMRPTFKEKDRVIVSKSKFGMNVPLLTKHFHFERALCKRGSTVVFTSENLKTPDKDMLYFYLFPGKKQFVKRLMGKPGDTLYFYGGKIYGIDRDGNDISSYLQNDALTDIEHIPFIRFEGSFSNTKNTIRQMGEEIVKFSPFTYNASKGQILTSNLYENPRHFKDYYDLWGYQNYAMARLVAPTHLDPLEKRYLEDVSSPLLLELHHSPSVTHSSGIHKCVTYIPLTENHLRTIFDNLYTARFVVKTNKAYRYGSTEEQSTVELKDIPDGTYEFYYGNAYKIYPTGVSKLLPKTHPLYEYSIDRLYLLYNIGIEMNSFYLPKSKEDPILPSRYAYFRDGELYVLGQPLLKSDDPALASFIELEQKKEKSLPFYKAFQDHGAPTDREFIRTYGLKIPENHYLMLGDNHAMSGDSRDFGLVPEENIKGNPSVIFWPPGNRWGTLPQPFIPWASVSNLAIWMLGITSLTIGSYLSRKKFRLPIKFE